MEGQIATLKAQGRVVPATEPLARALLSVPQSALITLSEEAAPLPVSQVFLSYLQAQPPVVQFGEVAFSGGGAAVGPATGSDAVTSSPDGRFAGADAGRRGVLEEAGAGPGRRAAHDAAWDDWRRRHGHKAHGRKEINRWHLLNPILGRFCGRASKRSSFRRSPKRRRMYDKIATRIESDKDTEEYAWLGALPGVREFLDERQAQDMTAYSYAIKNKTWESTISRGPGGAGR